MVAAILLIPSVTASFALSDVYRGGCREVSLIIALSRTDLNAEDLLAFLWRDAITSTERNYSFADQFLLCAKPP